MQNRPDRAGSAGQFDHTGSGVLRRTADQHAKLTNVVRLAVVGAHLSGEPLNGQLTSRGATLVATTRTARVYRLFALPTDPPKPGLVRVGDVGGAGAIDVEVWQLDAAAFGTFVDEIPAPLGIGRVLLADGTDVAGFLCEPLALEGATDITEHGGWRAYRAALPG